MRVSKKNSNYLDSSATMTDLGLVYNGSQFFARQNPKNKFFLYFFLLDIPYKKRIIVSVPRDYLAGDKYGSLLTFATTTAQYKQIR